MTIEQSDRDAAQALCASCWTHVTAAFAAHRIAERERWLAALTPSNREQAEYMNLFHWTEPDFDECGGRTMRHVSMPWPKIKAALAALRDRAQAIRGDGHEG